MTASQIQQIALSVSAPPYSIDGILKIQTAIFRKTGEYLSYGHVSAAVAGIERQARQELAEQAEPKKARMKSGRERTQTRPCRRCGVEFVAAGQHRVCAECQRQRIRETQRRYKAKIRAMKAAGG
jgi:molybdenum cofactor biosynthesis enzyme MoaA